MSQVNPRVTRIHDHEYLRHPRPYSDPRETRLHEYLTRGSRVPEPAGQVSHEYFHGSTRDDSGAGFGTQYQLSRLEKDFGLDIGKNKLYKIHKRLGVTTVHNSRKTRNETEINQQVLDLKESDMGGWGVDQVKGCLAQEGTLISRELLENHEQNNTTLLCKLWVLGIKNILTVMKSWQNKDQWGAFLHSLVLMPNVRDANAIAHYYLDLIEDHGFWISTQLTTDKGSEVNKVHKIHERLQSEAAPEYMLPEWPFSVKQTSMKNTPIESFWHWLRDGEGYSVKLAWQDSSLRGIFLPNNPIHQRASPSCLSTFYWLWVPIIQDGLDTFR
ncbi:hypothetical protein B0H10DRAFT_1955512 [Mycena sp. CBHHK59/15]|nr:hypothetical protein B0H10DRAFT_1955512 [Mycena sp. CBHHK59/15]